jgi:hypothetical protein
MGPLAAIYHPGGADPNGYPVSIVNFISTWSEETGTITEAICVMTDGSIRTLAMTHIQVVDRSVAEAIVAASAAADRQRVQQGTVPPIR